MLCGSTGCGVAAAGRMPAGVVGRSGWWPLLAQAEEWLGVCASQALPLDAMGLWALRPVGEEGSHSRLEGLVEGENRKQPFRPCESHPCF